MHEMLTSIMRCACIIYLCIYFLIITTQNIRSPFMTLTRVRLYLYGFFHILFNPDKILNQRNAERMYVGCRFTVSEQRLTGTLTWGDILKL